MIHDFKISHDLYFWGQDRFGSLIPLIGQFFYKICHLTPVAAESFSHYLLLILGYLGFTTLFRSKYVKIIFVMVWFLPPLRMIDILKVGMGEQYALIGIAAFLINKIYNNSFEKYLLMKYFLLAAVTVIFILAIWVSDLAVITIFLILSIHLIFYFKYNRFSLNKILKNSELYYIIVGFALGTAFIIYAKKNAVKVENYYDFFDFKTLAASIRIFAGTIVDLFLFKIKEPFTSIYSYMLAISIIIISLSYRYIKFMENHVKWMLIFSMDLVLVFLIIISSHWAYLNGIPRRYFVCNYVSFWLIFLMTIEDFKKASLKNILLIFLFLTVVTGGLGTIYNFKYISPKKLTPTIKTASEFKRLGRIGIIAEYWNSYLSSAPDPDHIKATPNDISVVRNQSLVDSVFAQPQIYVIKDMWMKSFPDTLEQFGYVLIKNGEEFRLGGSQLCNYRKSKISKIFFSNKFKSNCGKLKEDPALNRDVLFVSKECDSCKNKHFLYGPYIPIGIGSFTARFYIKVEQVDNSPFATFDVAGDWGNKILATKEFGKDFVAGTNYDSVDLDFKTNKRYTNLEFRIYYYGNADISFDHLKLVEH